MGVLTQAKPLVFVCTTNRPQALRFYRDILGLRVSGEDEFAVIFDLGGVKMRLSTVPALSPSEHPILGLDVPSVRDAVVALRDKGVAFLMYEGFGQDELGIWTSPGGEAQVAWFKDPDGNLLSVNSDQRN